MISDFETAIAGDIGRSRIVQELISVPTPNQSYLAKQMQWRMAAALGSVARDFGVNAKSVWGCWNGSPGKSTWYPTAWRIADQKFFYRPAWGGGSGGAHVVFSNPRFDPLRGNIWYGDKRIAQNVQENIDAKAKIIRNTTDGLIKVTYGESVEVTNSFSSAVTKGVSLDMTASAASTQTVSGEYAGVKAEVSLTEQFGISKSESEEEQKEASEEGTKSESLSIEFDAEPRNNYLVTISKEHATTYQPFKIQGVMDFDFRLHIPRASNQQHSGYYPGSDVHVIGVDGFAQFIHGYDTDYPKIGNFYDVCYSGTKQAIAYIINPANRYIEVEGTIEANLDSNASYQVEQLGSDIPDALKHLPVVDAENVHD